MSENPKTFVVTYNDGRASIERSLSFATANKSADEILLRIDVARADVIGMSLTDLNRQALETAIQHLQNLLSKLPAKQE